MDKVVSNFLPDGFWRDLLSLSWDHRTLQTVPTIKTFLEEDGRFKASGLKLLGLDGTPIIIQANEGSAGAIIHSVSIAETYRRFHLDTMFL